MRGCGVWIIISKHKTPVVGYLFSYEERVIYILLLGSDMILLVL